MKTVFTITDDEEITEDTRNESFPPDIYGRSNVSTILTITGNISDDGIRFTCRLMSEAETSPEEISFVLHVSSNYKTVQRRVSRNTMVQQVIVAMK